MGSNYTASGDGIVVGQRRIDRCRVGFFIGNSAVFRAGAAGAPGTDTSTVVDQIMDTTALSRPTNNLDEISRLMVVFIVNNINGGNSVGIIGNIMVAPVATVNCIFSAP